MSKEELEIAVLHSDLKDDVKLEIIRCIEKANNYSYSQPHIKDFPKEVTCGVKGLS